MCEYGRVKVWTEFSRVNEYLIFDEFIEISNYSSNAIAIFMLLDILI